MVEMEKTMKTMLSVSTGFLFLLAAATMVHAQRPPPIVTLAALDDSATEGTDDFGAVVVRRDRGLGTNLRVYYGIGGTAQNGTDYERLSGSVVIPAGSYEAQIDIVPIDDEVQESTKRVVIYLKAPPPYAGRKYRLGAEQRQAVQILDNDQPAPPPPLPSLSVYLTPFRHQPPSLYREPAVIYLSIADWAPWTIAYVEIFGDGQLLGVMTNPNPGHPPPNWLSGYDTARFKFTWSDVPAGTHSIIAKGTTTDGQEVFSNELIVEVLPRQ